METGRKIGCRADADGDYHALGEVGFGNGTGMLRRWWCGGLMSVLASIGTGGILNKKTLN